MKPDSRQFVNSRKGKEPGLNDYVNSYELANELNEC